MEMSPQLNLHDIIWPYIEQSIRDEHAAVEELCKYAKRDNKGVVLIKDGATVVDGYVSDYATPGQCYIMNTANLGLNYDLR